MGACGGHSGRVCWENSGALGEQCKFLVTEPPLQPPELDLLQFGRPCNKDKKFSVFIFSKITNFILSGSLCPCLSLSHAEGRICTFKVNTLH